MIAKPLILLGVSEVSPKNKRKFDFSTRNQLLETSQIKIAEHSTWRKNTNLIIIGLYICNCM